MTKSELESEVHLLNDIIHDLIMEVRELRRAATEYAQCVDDIGLGAPSRGMK